MLNAGFTKLSVLFLYLRIFPHRSLLRTIIYVFIAATAAWMISEGITNFLLCIPLNAYWDVFFTGPQTCLDDVPYFAAFSVIDLVLDTAIYILPLSTIMNLRISNREKWAISGVFGVGILYGYFDSTLNIDMLI
jgi:hypothetical protein